jgi:hypothetical protein
MADDDLPTYEEMMDGDPVANDPVLQFGKYKGHYVSRVPTSYLDWLVGLETLDHRLKNKVLRHLRTRADWQRD